MNRNAWSGIGHPAKIELAGDGEHRISNGFGFEPTDASMAQQNIAGVLGLCCFTFARVLSVGTRKANRTYQMLDGPLVSHQVAGEVIEQFGMGWWYA